MCTLHSILFWETFRACTDTTFSRIVAGLVTYVLRKEALILFLKEKKTNQKRCYKFSRKKKNELENNSP